MPAATSLSAGLLPRSEGCSQTVPLRGAGGRTLYVHRLPGFELRIPQILLPLLGAKLTLFNGTHAVFRKRQLVCGDLQWLPPPRAHNRPCPERTCGPKRPAESSLTTEGGQAAEAASPGAAPVQVTEGLQADGTCGDSTVTRRDTSRRAIESTTNSISQRPPNSTSEPRIHLPDVSDRTEHLCPDVGMEA